MALQIRTYSFFSAVVFILFFAWCVQAADEPMFAVYPAAALPGDAVRVTGSGWDAGEKTLALINEAGEIRPFAPLEYINVCPKTLGGRGCARGEIGYALTIPRVAPGSYMLAVMSPLHTAVADLTVLRTTTVVSRTPKILLDPVRGKPGATVVVSGAGFIPKSGLWMTFDKEKIQLGRGFGLDADLDGKYSAVITIPFSAQPGTHTITATNGRGDTAIAQFVVVAESTIVPVVQPLKDDFRVELKEKSKDILPPRGPYQDIAMPRYGEISAPRYGETSAPRYFDVPVRAYGEGVPVRSYGMVPLGAQALNSFTQSALAGTYPCRSYNVSGGGGGCRIMRPLVLNSNGTYSVGSEKGTYRVSGSTLRLSQSKIRGAGTIVRTPGSVQIVFEYDYQAKPGDAQWHHTLTYERPVAAPVVQPVPKISEPQMPVTVAVKIIAQFSSEAGWISTLDLAPNDDPTSSMNALALLQDDKQTVVGNFWTVPTGKMYTLYASSGFDKKQIGTVDTRGAMKDMALTITVPH